MKLKNVETSSDDESFHSDEFKDEEWGDESISKGYQGEGEGSEI